MEAASVLPLPLYHHRSVFLCIMPDDGLTRSIPPFPLYCAVHCILRKLFSGVQYLGRYLSYPPLFFCLSAHSGIWLFLNKLTVLPCLLACFYIHRTGNETRSNAVTLRGLRKKKHSQKQQERKRAHKFLFYVLYIYSKTRFIDFF